MKWLRDVLHNNQGKFFDLIKGTIKRDLHVGKYLRTDKCIQDEGSFGDAPSPENAGD